MLPTAAVHNFWKFLEGSPIEPITDSPDRREFIKALLEVLSRLPGEVFCLVESDVRFVVEEPSMDLLALNVSAPPSRDGRGKKGVDNVVFFRKCLEFEFDALVGLIAHEIAHSFISAESYHEDEAIVNAKAREWGFERECECFKREKELFLQKTASGRKG